MKVLVTGASGYVGSRVVAQLLAAGHAVSAGVRDAARPVPAGATAVAAPLDQPDRIAALAAQHDGIVHTAFPTHVGDWFAAVEMERAVMDALAAALADTDKRLVVANGTAFYGDGGGAILDETTPIADHPAAVRAAATGAATGERVNGAELRLASFVYGDGGSVFLPIMVEHARRTGRSIYVGDGEARISAVHVDDAAAAFVAALGSHARGVFHVASDEAPTIKALAEAVALGTGARAQSVTADEAAEAVGPFPAMFLGLDNRLSSLRARTELGWMPRHPDGILWDVAFGSYRTLAAAA